MNTMEFLELAASKDETRFNLTRIYRDVDALVATDGHRLHYVDQPKVEKGFFVDGTDAQFPNWKEVVPNNAVIHTMIFTSKMWCELLPRLKAMKAFIKTFDRINYYTRLSYSTTGMKLEAGNRLNPEDTASVMVMSEGYKESEKLGHVYLNLSYLIDAIACEKKSYLVEEIKVEFREPLQPIVVSHSTGKAIIMPLRSAD